MVVPRDATSIPLPQLLSVFEKQMSASDFRCVEICGTLSSPSIFSRSQPSWDYLRTIYPQFQAWLFGDIHGNFALLFLNPFESPVNYSNVQYWAHTYVSSDNSKDLMLSVYHHVITTLPISNRILFPALCADLADVLVENVQGLHYDQPLRPCEKIVKSTDVESPMAPEGFEFGSIAADDLPYMMSVNEVSRSADTFANVIHLCPCLRDQSTGKLVSWCFLGPNLAVQALYTEPAFRGRGLASIMLQQLLYNLKQAGVKNGWSEYFATNEASKQAFKKAGWRVVGSGPWFRITI